MNRAAGMQPLHVAWRRRLSWARLWPALPALAAVLAVPGLFSTSRIFYVRDLGFAFWPLHLWLRRTVLAGESPLWDPYVGMGAPTVADPIRQLAFVPGLVLRLVLPDELGFNLWVALAFPVAGTGTYLLCRRFVAAPAAALGGALFAASGPTLSTGNFPNLSWSIALAPWVLWSAFRVTDRPQLGHAQLGQAGTKDTEIRKDEKLHNLWSHRRLQALRGAARYRATPVAWLAVVVALQICAGEPVTAVLTAIVALAAVVIVAADGSWLSRGAMASAGVAAGALLAGAFTLPLLDAASRSMRSRSADSAVTNVWALHPLGLVETVMPFLFGETIVHGRGASPWVAPLNGGFEPYLFSIYVGAPALALASAGLAGGAISRRARVFWFIVLVGGVACALGAHTPIYPAIQTAFPILRAFRSPSKYLLIATLAISVLSAAGWQALAIDARARAAVVGAALALGFVGLLLFVVVSNGCAGSIVDALAGWARVDPVAGTEYLVEALDVAAPRLVALSAGLALVFAIGFSRQRLASVCRVTSFAVVVADPLVVNAVLNPQIDARELGRPGWIDRVAAGPDDRVYVAGRVASLNPVDDDWRAAAGPALSTVPAVEANALGAAAVATFTSPWRVRDSITSDLAAIRPREYTTLLVRFARSPLADRRVFLSRIGVRYQLTSVAPDPSARRLADLEAYTPMSLFETPYALPRAFVVAGERVEPSIGRQQELMFTWEFEAATTVLLLESPPAASGVPASVSGSGAVIVEDGMTRVTVDASTGQSGGYLVLSDSYDPDWRASVDGEPARIILANGNFRAVRLAPGPHRVVFEYHPRAFAAGLVLTLVSAGVLGAWVAVARRRPQRERGR